MCRVLEMHLWLAYSHCKALTSCVSASFVKLSKGVNGRSVHNFLILITGANFSNNVHPNSCPLGS